MAEEEESDDDELVLTHRTDGSLIERATEALDTLMEIIGHQGEEAEQQQQLLSLYDHLMQDQLHELEAWKRQAILMEGTRAFRTMPEPFQPTVTSMRQAVSDVKTAALTTARNLAVFAIRSIEDIVILSLIDIIALYLIHPELAVFVHVPLLIFAVFTFVRRAHGRLSEEDTDHEEHHHLPPKPSQP